ncbi:MAG: hypothetical protein L3J58_12860 [Emcibacter sp.]|nr:hypothetical protein [Emcibacter sp.]
MYHRKTYSDLKKIYLKALDNEVSLSAFWGKHYGKSEKEHWLPNNAVINKKFHNVILILSRLYYIVAILWLLVQPFLFVLEYIRWGRKNFKKNKLKCQNVFLYSSPGSNFNYIKKGSENYPTTGIILPWLKVNKIPEDMSLIDIREISSFKVFLISCGLAYLIMLRVMFDPKRIKRVLYTYTALRWFFVRLTFEDINLNSIWLTNHYDRWVIMLDSLNVQKRVMVQHGSLIDMSQPVFVSYVMQNKLMNEWELYLYSKDEYQKFYECLFSVPPELKLFEIELALDKNLCRGQKSILILGNPRLQDKLITIIRLLKQKHDNNFIIAYRPHPREDIKNLVSQKEELNFIINDDERLIPETSVVLSYGSSIDELLLKKYPANIIRFDTGRNFDENHIVSIINKAIG